MIRQHPQGTAGKDEGDDERGERDEKSTRQTDDSAKRISAGAENERQQICSNLVSMATRVR